MLVMASVILLSTLVASDETPSSTPFSMARRVRPDDNFNPRYRGKIIFRHRLNLTESAKKVPIQPDYYASDEAQDFDEDSEELRPQNEEGKTYGVDSKKNLKLAPLVYAITSTQKPKDFHMSDYVTPSSSSKPKYNGKIIHRYELNLTDNAKKIEIKPDYYEAGEGPEDDDYDDLIIETKVGEKLQEIPKETITTTTTTTQKPFMMSKYVTAGPNFKPKYKGKIIHRDQLNLTERAKKVEIKPDYYEPGEGPEDDEEDEISTVEESIQSTTTTTSGPTKETFMFSKFVTPDPNFKPKYKGKIIHRDELNLTDSAKNVEIKPDYYGEGEGPVDDEDESVDLSEPGKIDITNEAKSTSISIVENIVSTTPATMAASTKKTFMFSKFVTPDPNFKPKYKGKVIHRDELNLTDSAKKIQIEPDYYDEGEGPIDDDDENDEVPDSSKGITSEATFSTTAASSNTSDNSNKKPFMFSKFVTVGPDFKPKYKGKIIHRDQLNLTDHAKKVVIEPDYYDPGEGKQDEDDIEDTEDKKSKEIAVDSTLASTTSTTTTTTKSYDTGAQQGDFEEPENDIDKAVGGISGVVEKILAGPKKNELTNTSKPEEVYAYLQNIIGEESGKALKATLPRIYDYQFPILNVVSQRCFNSFAQFGDRFRRGFVWPAQSKWKNHFLC